MLADWNLLSDELQLTLSREAMRQAAEVNANQTELLAEEVDRGQMADRNAADALRHGEHRMIPAGRVECRREPAFVAAICCRREGCT